METCQPSLQATTEIAVVVKKDFADKLDDVIWDNRTINSEIQDLCLSDCPFLLSLVQDTFDDTFSTLYEYDHLLEEVEVYVPESFVGFSLIIQQEMGVCEVTANTCIIEIVEDYLQTVKPQKHF